MTSTNSEKQFEIDLDNSFNLKNGTYKLDLGFDLKNIGIPLDHLEDIFGAAGTALGETINNKTKTDGGKTPDPVKTTKTTTKSTTTKKA